MIDMTVFTFVGCDNTFDSIYAHIGFTNYFPNSESLVSYIDHNSSDYNTHDYAIIIGI